MSITINSMIPALAREIRDVASPYQFSNDDLHSALVDGVGEMNSEHYQQYEVSGTGSTAIIAPDPDSVEQRIWLLFSAIILLRGEKVKATATALSISMPSGRTDLTDIPKEIGNAIDSLEKKLYRILNLLNRGLTEAQMASREKTRQET